MKAVYDAIVIGSGFGGAITACRLSQAGRSVCILEKGRHWQRHDFPRATGEVARSAVWNKSAQGGPDQGFIEYVPFKRMDVIQGVGVGGGSLHYFNVHLRPPPTIFNSSRWPANINLKTLTPYYELAADMLAAKTLSPPMHRALPLRTKAFREAAECLGQQAEAVPICVHTASERHQSPGGREQSACDYCGNCLLGCHKHAKNTLDLNYIPMALHHGAELFAQHEALCITPKNGCYTVSFKDYREGEQPRLAKVSAKQVILGAGTLGTNELLLRCKEQYRTLPNLSPSLGERFSSNGDFLFAGAYFKDKVIDPGRGPSITSGLAFNTPPEQHIYIEDLGFPDPFIWYFNALLARRGRTRQLLEQCKRYCLNALGVNIEFELDRMLEDGYLSHFMPFLGMGSDAADGRLYLNKSGQLEMDWSYRNSKRMFKAMTGHMRALSEAAGGRFVNSFMWRTPLLGLPVSKTLTAHPLGGASMADTPLHGVTNPQGEVWGYPGLYVSDGALLPAAIAVNPSATISAMAERVAFHLLHGRELKKNDRLRPTNLLPASVSTPTTPSTSKPHTRTKRRKKEVSV